MFDFRRITLFCLGYYILKHKMTTYVKNLGGTVVSWGTPGYAYGHWLVFMKTVMVSQNTMKNTAHRDSLILANVFT